MNTTSKNNKNQLLNRLTGFNDAAAGNSTYLLEKAYDLLTLYLFFNEQIFKVLSKFKFFVI